MKREDILKRLNMKVPEGAKIRMIIDTDAKNEADDQYAIMHHLLTPQFDVRGIVATHYESKAQVTGETMEKSYEEVVKVLQLAEIDDVSVYRGCPIPLKNMTDAPDSEGVRFIIEEAKRDCDMPLYIAIQGAATNVAAALNQAPEIGEKIVLLWNGGGPYPEGRPEFNVMQDPDAARVILEKDVEVWQSHQDVYAKFEVSIAELALKVRPCGKLGQYLYDQLEEQNLQDYNPHFLLRTGANWNLGDNTTIAMVLENAFRGHWEMRKAPIINDALFYDENSDGKMIRVYNDLDVRMALEDFFAKLALAYK